MQNFKTVAQTFLGETAHFGFFPHKIGFLGGLGVVPEIFFSFESSYFCELGSHAKFQNCSTNPSGRNSTYRLLSVQNQLFVELGEVPDFFPHWNPNIFVA